MPQRSRSTTGLVIALFVLAAALGVRATAAQDRRPSALVDELDDLAAFGVPGAVLVREPSGVLVAHGFGLTRPDGEPIGARTRFDIGSLAKQFTAAAVLALSVDGRLALSDSVGRFLPQAPPAIAAIRIEQLLTHASGLPGGNLTGSDGADTTPTPRDSALARLFRARLRFAPGTKQAYSNAGYVLLAAIVEQAGGASYGEYLKRRLFARAGLRDTRCWGEPGTARVAAGTDELGVVFDPAAAPADHWTLRGAGGVLSSIDDLDRWMRALTAGRVLPAGIVAKMMSSRYGGHGYGWRIGEPGTRYEGAVYHGGDYPGSGSQLVWWPDRGRLVVVLTNVRHEADTYPTRLVIENAVFAWLDGAARRTPRVAGSARAALQAGRYRGEDGSSFEIERGPWGLRLGARNQAAVNHLWSPTADTAATWRRLGERSAALLRASLTGDTAAIRAALAPTDDPPYVAEQLAHELRGVRGDRTSAVVHALGTYPAATPPGAQWTVCEIRTGAGATPYRLRWYRDHVGSYHARSPALASAWALAPADSGSVAWDPVHDVAPVTLRAGRAGRLVLGARSGDLELAREP